MRQQYTRDLSQWLWHKRSPFPGAWLAPLQLPGICALWANGTVGNRIIDMTEIGNHIDSDATPPGVDQAASWPGVSYWWSNSDQLRIDLSVGGDSLQITGACSVGGWVKLQADTVAQNVCANGSPHAAYDLGYAGSGVYTWSVKPAGAAISVSTAAQTAGVWTFIAGRFVPSTSIDIYVDTVKTTNTTGVPASLPTVAPPDGFWVLSNKQSSQSILASQIWVCSYAVPDAVLTWLYRIQAPLFGR